MGMMFSTPQNMNNGIRNGVAWKMGQSSVVPPQKGWMVSYHYDGMRYEFLSSLNGGTIDSYQTLMLRCGTMWCKSCCCWSNSCFGYTVMKWWGDALFLQRKIAPRWEKGRGRAAVSRGVFTVFYLPLPLSSCHGPASPCLAAAWPLTPASCWKCCWP